MKKIIELANSISNVPNDSPNAHQESDPPVQLLKAMIDDDLAEIALMCTKAPQTIEQIAESNQVDTESIREKIIKLGQLGILFFEDKEDGLRYYSRVPWVPGILEHCLLNPDTRTYEVAKYFDATGMRSGVMGSFKVPKGAGFMRVIPIGKSIDAQSKTVTYEEVKTYLDQSDYFSAAPCACRTSKKILGNPCEHQIEDRCIQIGKEAEYYVKTGRARRITREEAEQILLDAEREGLVHEIFNNEGVNHSTFLCNCCGCSCSVLRRVTLLRCPDYVRSNFVAKVNPDNCVACGACVEHCNANALVLGNTLTGEKAKTTTVTPYDNEWGEEKWDKENWRKRIMVSEGGTSPCKSKCPAHISIQGYIKKASQGKYDEALRVIKRDNPFPAVCGRVCPHSCETECTRNKLDEPLAIDEIKKFIADLDLKSEDTYVPKVYTHYQEKVAVIGGGPAGLSCAYYLGQDGYKVTVFEKNERLGGMLTTGIPAFRLERDVIDAEIEIIRKLGAEFRCGVEIGKDITIQELREQGYKAFYIAIGAQAGRMLGIEGEHAQGVVTGVDFLRNISLNPDIALPGKTVVIGGGNVAIDVARSAVRISDRRIGMYCLESAAEMPALPEEQEEAKGEGVDIFNGWGPKRILEENGKVTGVEFKKCLAVFDEEGRFNPSYDENDTITVEADNVLLAIGQGIVWGGLLENTTLKTGRGNTLQVKEISFQSDEEDIFAGGDVVTGPKFAIDAIAAGKQGAISIHRYLRGRGLTVKREREYNPLDKKNLALAGYDQKPREKTPEVNPQESRKTFKDLRKTLTEEQIKKETSRCLGCGVTYVDEYQCIGCGVCATKCEFDAIKLVRNNDAPSLPKEELASTIAKYQKEREERIAKRKAMLGKNKPESVVR